MRALLFICIICLTGCSKKDATVYENVSFEDICSTAMIHGSPFCIALTDTSNSLSKEYIYQLRENYDYLYEKSFYNIIDINTEENEWYLKWLRPASIPLTCVFSSDGTLIDLIPGVSKETFLYTDEAIKNLKATDFHWPNLFHMNKKQVVPLLNDILVQKESINQGIYTPLEMDQLIDSLQYPYSYFLKLVGELMTDNIGASQQTAKSLINLETPYSFDLYRNEFITARKVLYPEFDFNAEPHIRVDSMSVHLTDCKENQRYPIEVLVYNDGNKPLIISKIHTSCSCLEHHKYDENIVIKPKSSFPIIFYFTPDMKGEMFREIFIASNAINIPILHIDIFANAI